MACGRMSFVPESFDCKLACSGDLPISFRNIDDPHYVITDTDVFCRYGALPIVGLQHLKLQKLKLNI